jgi:hypothetical protein
VWELLDRPGEAPKTYTIDGEEAISILNQAVAAGEAAGLTWMEEKLVLKPAQELKDLVRKSQEVMTVEGDSEDA